MITQAQKTLFILSSILLLAYTSNTFANSCSESNISFYLKNGFTHDQIVKLCVTNKTQPTTSYAPHTAIPSPLTAPSIQNNHDKEQLYFETVINADPVILRNDKLSFDRRECAVYGELDMTETRDKICINTRTHINLKGLQIIRVTKGIPLIRKQEFLVKGVITREYLNDTSQISHYKMDAINRQLPTHPDKIQIPIRSGIDPKIVARKLNRYL